MRRGKVLFRLLVLAALAGGTAALVALAPFAQPQVVRPNVLVVTIETLRADHCSLYGYGRPTTPFLQELSRECITFDNAWSDSSWTKPSMASIVTGLPPHVHQMYSGADKLPPDLPSFPQMLQQAGYSTAGVWTNGTIARPEFGYSRGFDFWKLRGWDPAPKVLSDALAWLDTKPRAPWLLFVHIFDPHGPYDAPPAFRGRFSQGYDGPLASLPELKPWELATALPEPAPADVEYVGARYDEDILYCDSELGRLVGALRERRMWDPALVIITADHGEELHEHGAWGHGRDVYQEKLRVPMVVKLPRGRRGGEHVSAFVSGVDVMPTVLTAAGLAVPEACTGADLARANGRDHHVATVRRFEWIDQKAGIIEWRDSWACVIKGGRQYIVGHDGEGNWREEFHDLSGWPAVRQVAETGTEWDDLRRLAPPPATWATAADVKASEETLQELRNLGYL